MSDIKTLEQFIAEIDRARARADALIPAATTAESIEAARVQLVGRTSGVVSVLSAALSVLPKEDRPEAGRRFNAWRVATEAALDAARTRLAAAAGSERLTDPTMPGRDDMARLPSSGLDRDRRDRGHLPRARVHGRVRPRGRARVVQLRRAQLPGRPPGDGHARHVVPGGGKAAAHAYVAGAGAHVAGLRATDSNPRAGERLSSRLLRCHPRAGLLAARGPRGRRGDLVRGPEGDAHALCAPVLRCVDAHTLRAVVLPVHRAFGADGSRGATSTTAAARAGSRSWDAAWCTPPCSNRRASTASGIPAGRSAWARARIAMSRYGINDIRLLYDSDVRFLEQFNAC